LAFLVALLSFGLVVALLSFGLVVGLVVGFVEVVMTERVCAGGTRRDDAGDGVNH
jgi:hypothetical protein